MAKSSNDAPHYVTLRPHHILCSQFFVGSGYSEDFVRNMTDILSRLNSDGTTVRFTQHCDEICSHCPRRDGSVCENEDHVLHHDSFCLQEYGISRDDELTWKEIRSAVLGKIKSDGRLPTVCDDCRWAYICTKLN